VVGEIHQKVFVLAEYVSKYITVQDQTLIQHGGLSSKPHLNFGI